MNLWKPLKKDNSDGEDVRSALNFLSQHIPSAYKLSNVFVTTHPENHFLYYEDSDNQKPKSNEEKEKEKEKEEKKMPSTTPLTQAIQVRTSMEWHDFVTHVSTAAATEEEESITNKKKKCVLSAKESYYLYGQPMPPALLPFIEKPNFLKNQLASTQLSSDDVLLWISTKPTCSPLHFDLCEGLLFQIAGQ
ncbi:hypothetical protein RFI_16903 [Reticulomyxa filosa]|uniref:Cupin-like domain-containing protein n=1 Tax=Reticulomyxa filosa TaxID=46433 RepID=X6N218_RETFI|nr:hypothetical protein RFI_16903 [Reticulomyxa filosa]|eukprot:ETO20315.1 hypothetical protein RFI_16903 [Reticulomyxa filosa]